MSYGIGYRFTETDVTGDPVEADSKDHTLFVAAVGELASALTAEVRMGVQERQFEQSVYDDETAFFMESLLRWVVSELTTVELHTGNGFDTDLNGVSKETFFVRLNLQHQLTAQLRALAGCGYEDIQYSNRRDDEQLSGSIGAVYTLIDDQLELGAGLRYAERDSNQLRSNYDVLNVELSLSFLF